MVRPRPHDFLDRLVSAGLQVFGLRGFAQSRMSDVARALGVSQGTLYNYVESKEALFGLLIERGADDGPVQLPDELPVRAVPPDELALRLDRQLRRSFALPALERALALEAAEDPRAELRVIVEELWQRTAATRKHADALERSVGELPPALQATFFGFRRRLFASFTGFVGARMRAGQLRGSGPPIVVATFLIETVTVFARHRHRDPDPSALPDEETVRGSVVELLLDSLTGG